MRLLLVSGLSGSGKTVALNTLEDAGFFCVDNLPLALLDALIQELRDSTHRNEGCIAVGVDVRSGLHALGGLAATLDRLRTAGVQVEVVFLQSSDEVLLRRYHHTRRRHPLARKGLPLVEAIAMERNWLGHIAALADLTIDSSRMSMHDLARTVRNRVASERRERLSLLFQSFGFKNGSPVDSDFVFDVRCLPNPYYEPGLREFTGLEAPVAGFLQAHPEVDAMFDSIQSHLQQWLPRFLDDHRNYLTVSIGCTGGRHRSVYLVDRLAKAWQSADNVTVSTRHRELDAPLTDAE
ncbi:RNase adapter RapZ [Thioalkalivibrio paradoxus]|uniref:GlmZ(SRNA)-inactivating NTPase n=1 Tax=Thioalkalivibrio paradoxus ARh 1 TaxID=713585 RepID=W0DL50_9GAMM|nr:RNase adapter RapZ [Thioalkalivibrio paradoxus]AHE99314.1 glmZ(sRNA)-inactivating NTPase [Thioalkalivibrio paradoxus ARh 1]